jgi:hypothetical protein
VYLNAERRDKGKHTARAIEAVYLGLTSNKSSWGFIVPEKNSLFRSGVPAAAQGAVRRRTAAGSLARSASMQACTERPAARGSYQQQQTQEQQPAAAIQQQKQQQQQQQACTRGLAGAGGGREKWRRQARVAASAAAAATTQQHQGGVGETAQTGNPGVHHGPDGGGRRGGGVLVSLAVRVRGPAGQLPGRAARVTRPVATPPAPWRPNALLAAQWGRCTPL